MKARIEITIGPTTDTYANLVNVVRQACDALLGRYGRAGVESQSGRTIRDISGTEVGRYEVVDGAHDLPDPTFPAPLPKWLYETVLSMEHDHNPAVRSYGDLLRRRMEGK